MTTNTWGEREGDLQYVMLALGGENSIVCSFMKCKFQCYIGEFSRSIPRLNNYALPSAVVSPGPHHLEVGRDGCVPVHLATPRGDGHSTIPATNKHLLLFVLVHFLLLSEMDFNTFNVLWVP